MKKYKARINRRWDCEAKIEEVEIERETDVSIWIKGDRLAKRSEDSNYYDTWEEAQRCLEYQQKSHVENAISRLERSRKVLSEIAKMSR